MLATHGALFCLHLAPTVTAEDSNVWPSDASIQKYKYPLLPFSPSFASLPPLVKLFSAVDDEDDVVLVVVVIYLLFFLSPTHNS